jgi:hypothetical protein
MDEINSSAISHQPSAISHQPSAIVDRPYSSSEICDLKSAI